VAKLEEQCAEMLQYEDAIKTSILMPIKTPILI
jgi:hypothetical protein